MFKILYKEACMQISYVNAKLLTTKCDTSGTKETHHTVK